MPQVLLHSSHVPLTPMQTMILLSEAEVAPDGKVDYYTLVQPLGNAVETFADRDNGPQRDYLMEVNVVHRARRWPGHTVARPSQLVAITQPPTPLPHPRGNSRRSSRLISTCRR